MLCIHLLVGLGTSQYTFLNALDFTESTIAWGCLLTYRHTHPNINEPFLTTGLLLAAKSKSIPVSFKVT